MAHDMVWARTYPIEGAPGVGVQSGRIVIACEEGARLSGKATPGFCGVTKEDTDRNGYAAAALAGVIDCTAGAPVKAGDVIASDHLGRGVPFFADGSFSQIAGVALTSAEYGASFKLLIYPCLVTG